MTRGRKPKPHNLQVIEGNLGKRAKLSAPIHVESQMEPPPSLLDDDILAQKIWNMLLPDLVKHQIYCALDRTTFARFCVHEADFWRNHNKLMAHGGNTYTTEGDSGVRHYNRPELAAQNDASRLANSIASEFGLSPVARKHLGNLAQGDLFGDAFGNFDR